MMGTPTHMPAHNTTQHNTTLILALSIRIISYDSIPRGRAFSGLFSTRLHWVNLQLPVIIFLETQARALNIRHSNPSFGRKNGNVVRIRRCQLLWWEPKIKFPQRTNNEALIAWWCFKSGSLACERCGL